MPNLKVLIALCGLAVAAPAFAGFDELINFSEVPVGTDANGLVIKNAQFSFQFENRALGASVVDIGNTDATNGPAIMGATLGTLGFNFARPVTRFQFAFAVNSGNTVLDAVSADLYTPGGDYITTLSALAGSPGLLGGGTLPVGQYASGTLLAQDFGCIGSAVVNFADFVPVPFGGESHFLFDNLGYDFCPPPTVPVPTPALLAGAGLMGLCATRRRRAL